jgi:drug/metabolite transporter (DMT)-like permease
VKNDLDRQKEAITVRLSLRAQGLLAVSIATVMLSTAGLMTRLVEVDGPTLMFLRGAIGGAFLFACMMIVSRRRAIEDLLHLGWSGLLICVTSAVAAILFIASLYATSVAHVAIIFATCPFVAAGLALLILGERPTAPALLASGVALAGVVLMVGGGSEGTLFGDLLAFAMTGMVALWTVLVRHHPDKPALACTAVAAIMTALIAAPFASPLAASAFDIGVVLVFGVFGFSLGVVLLLIGSRLLPPVESALIGALDAPLAPLWVFLVVGEVPHRNTVIGGAIVFLAVCLHIASGRQGSKACRVTIDP